MEFDEVLIQRSSIRSFKNKSVNDEITNKIIQSTISAPSAGNLQAYKIYIIENKELILQLTSASLNQEAISESSLVFVFCALPDESGAKYGDRGKKLYSLQDATIAATYCQLAVTNLELASVWIGAFVDKEVKKVLNLPDNETPVAIIPIGYPNEIPYPSDRKTIDKVITRIK